MKIISLILSILFCIVFVSCSNYKENNDTNSKKNTGNYDFKISDFEKLNIGDSMESITKKFGESYEDIGSGLHILVYKFDDNHIILNFSMDNTLTKVTLQSKDEPEKILLGE